MICFFCNKTPIERFLHELGRIRSSERLSRLSLKQNECNCNLPWWTFPDVHVVYVDRRLRLYRWGWSCLKQTGSLRRRFKVLIKRSRSVGHFCVSLFALFGVYATAPRLHSGRGGSAVARRRHPPWRRARARRKPKGTERQRQRER